MSTKAKQPVDKRLTTKEVEAWEERNGATLRAGLAKAERDVRAGKSTQFDPMKPGALLNRIVGSTRRRRAA